MLSVRGLKRVISGKLLFDGVTFHVNDGEVVALAGDNGTGKSTLLRFIAGLESPDGGAISHPRDTTIGYLPQDIALTEGATLDEYLHEPFSDVASLQGEARELEERFAMPDYDEKKYQKLMDRYGEIQDLLLARDAYEIEGKIAEVLRGLGFRKRDLGKRVDTFSGGWQLKICLARLLLLNPGILLLDEPTNPLDIDARNWLEEFLTAYRHSVLIVSHDRHFLDATVCRIHELFNRGLETYHCKYSQYLVEREARVDKVYKMKEKQDEEIARVREFVARNRTRVETASLCQSRLKALERMEIIQVPPRRRKIRFRFPPAPPCGNIVLEAEGLAKSYGDHRVFEGVGFTALKGEKIVLLGVNGAGKSTLIKILTGHVKADRGEYRLGAGVVVDYFAQDQTYRLDNTATVLEEMLRHAPIDMVPAIRSLLALFLFQAQNTNIGTRSDLAASNTAANDLLALTRAKHF